ncbi:hypothetical protein GALMADRAFT_65558 [Galerina marginata CBS 339.88]|uniref:Ribonuclease H1 N-terminal domain-containing protein n=1 Tax=Galerina marginata (strain CBS 339.88) TaxID=685588 RepID=A0A067T2N2_GALM3|nr:hypothetical protein GALMADRAFT_65558 [Galerina marginata CBS 339.88]
MTPSKARESTTSPPPINRATRPQTIPTTSANLLQDRVEESRTTSPRFIPVLVDSDDLDQLREAFRLLGLPAHPQPTQNLQALLRHLCHSNATQHTQSEVQDACLDGSDPIQDPTSAFSGLSASSPSPSLAASTAIEVPRLSNIHLSASTAPGRLPALQTAPLVTASTSHGLSRPLGVRTAPSSGSFPSALTSPKKIKYYVIVAGKCTGIYYDEWENVKDLIHQVPGAVHKSFSTYEQAEQYYLNAKFLGRVKCIRNPGDDEIYGPRKNAIQ